MWNPMLVVVLFLNSNSTELDTPEIYRLVLSRGKRKSYRLYRITGESLCRRSRGVEGCQPACVRRLSARLRPPFPTVMWLRWAKSKGKNTTEMGFDLRVFVFQGGVSGDTALPAGCFTAEAQEGRELVLVLVLNAGCVDDWHKFGS